MTFNASSISEQQYSRVATQHCGSVLGTVSCGDAQCTGSELYNYAEGVNVAYTQSINSMSDSGSSVPGAPGEPGTGGGSDTQTASSIDVLERTEEEKSPGDNDRYAHYVRQDKIMRSMVEGGPVVALCGKVWTPVRNPDGYPICPMCKAIYDEMKKGGSQGGAWPFGSEPPQ